MVNDDVKIEKSQRDSMLALLTSRVSHPKLSDPAPSPEEMEYVFQAGLRTPDHKCLKPWRFLVIEGESLSRLGEVFVQAALSVSGEVSDTQQAKYRAMPLRAPRIIVGISKNIDHPKVPVEEQVISCGVAMGYMLLALQAQGYGGIWRTGEMATSEYVKRELGLAEEESIVGFLYLGTPQAEPKNLNPVYSHEHFKVW